MNAPHSARNIDAALMGICHWMGYRHQLYPHHPLTEGALVGELAGLLSAHLHTDLAVVLEQPYSTFSGALTAPVRGRPPAADIVIGARSSITQVGDRRLVSPNVVIEVKRSQHNDWPADLKKLSTVWSPTAGWTAWVLLLDQAVAVGDAARRGWVGAAGRASRKRQQSRDGIPFVVRRVTHTQSAHALRVHRAVLLELA